jgi:hypothetical protein
MKTYVIVNNWDSVLREVRTDVEQTVNPLHTSRRLRDKYIKEDLSQFTI